MTLFSLDKKTAYAFSNSWNNLPLGSVYSKSQFEDWMKPLVKGDVEGKEVLELGCGNASLMVHMVNWAPKYIEGVDLGSSVKVSQENMKKTKFKNWKIKRLDMISYHNTKFDLVYCIGVLHHLNEPKLGFEAVIRNVKSGGRFHCWVYGREGNEIIFLFLDPVRKLVSHLPWRINKYFIATPLVVPFYIYAHVLVRFKQVFFIRKLPLFQYSLWISQREFSFFRHVAFDQLVTPKTTYFDKNTIQSWLKSSSKIDQKSTYIIRRNGNSWKFGGKIL